jgi:hypothetical protein
LRPSADAYWALDVSRSLMRWPPPTK